GAAIDAAGASGERGEGDAAGHLRVVPDALPELPASGGVIVRVLARRELGLVAAMLAIVLPVTAINGRMLSPTNLVALSMDAALLMIVAAAQMLVLVTRNIDLSVASVIGLSAYGAAVTL